MKDFDILAKKIREGMYQGNRHVCFRDIGRLAGGYLAAGRIGEGEADELKRMAVELAGRYPLAEREWNEAVGYGRAQPVEQRTAPAFEGENRAIGWDEVVNPDEYRVVDRNWLETEAVAEPSAWNPCRELAEYIGLLFQPTDIVAYCTDPFEVEGRWVPSKGAYTKTAGEILKSLRKNTEDGFTDAVGTLNNDRSGAWIRINPFDGKGVKDENVTDFRHALIECDAMPVDEQVATYRKLELPCACIVHSGGKSAHAVVKVNASSLEEYRRRVDFLYEVCRNNGLVVDKQNRNPSRYSRMPGVMRGGRKQYIIERGCGKASWDEWENWIKDVNDDLPEFEPLTESEVDNPPAPADELIEGVLRVRHKMIISGPSKAGKSFLLIELAICIAEGLEWLGHRCRPGRVLYVNLELDRDSCTRRFADVYRAMGVRPRHGRSIFRWNLRGRTMPLDRLAPKLIRRAKDGRYDAIIVDPIYKVLTGDENSASDMAAFCNLFDRIGHDCGAAVVFCHHHSKGVQGEKKAADRAAGSGVFARDPDAIMDILPMDMGTVSEILSNREECEAMLKEAALLAYDDEWRDCVTDADRECANALVEKLRPLGEEEICAARERAKETASHITGWTISLTLREFATPRPFGMFFRYPLHVLDEENYLAECAYEGEDPRRPGAKRKTAPKIDKASAFRQMVEFNPGEAWTVAKAMDRMGAPRRTIYNWLTKFGWTTRNGIIVAGSVKRDEEAPGEDPMF